MTNRLIFILIFQFEILCQCLSKKLILLPYNSELCKSSVNGVNKFQEFTISQQLNFETSSNTSDVLRSVNTNNATDTSLYLPWQIDNYKFQYFCRVLVKPMGRQLEVHIEQVKYSFWEIRVRIDRLQLNSPSPNSVPVTNCSDRLLLQFRHTQNLISSLDSHSAQVVNLTCKDSLPIVIPSNIRKLYITYFSTNPDSEGFTINVTTFIYFQGDFPISFKKEICRNQDGFWCANETNECIYGRLVCDKSDSCFDGGSDEFYCNHSSHSNITQSVRTKGTFIDYLPWLALAILPLILLMALVCICNQHRSEVFFDDDEDNLDVEKSQEENADHMWSSLDALDQLDKPENDQEGNENNCEEDGRLMHLTGKEPLIGLQTINCSAIIKAEITTSCTGNSLNKDYEDIDKPIIIAKGDSGLTNLPASDFAKDVELDEKRPDLPQMEFLTNSASNVMTISQVTDDDYVLEDVGSLLRKVDKSKIPEELRINSMTTSAAQPEGETPNSLVEEAAIDYRSDYILV